MRKDGDAPLSSVGRVLMDTCGECTARYARLARASSGASPLTHVEPHDAAFDLHFFARNAFASVSSGRSLSA